MIVSVGTDLVATKRIRELLEKDGRVPSRFEERVFTEAERSYCREKHDPSQSAAARFAAKEAVMKCLGEGWDGGFSWQDIEVLKNDQGAPSLALYGVAKERAEARGITRWHLSLTHTDEFAQAMVVAEGAADGA